MRGSGARWQADSLLYYTTSMDVASPTGIELIFHWKPNFFRKSKHRRWFYIVLPSIRLRIGINTGEIVRREGQHPFGQAVVMASRMVEKCEGRQILVSAVSKQLAAGSKFSFIEKGRFLPKGFEEHQKIYEVVWS